MRAFCTPKAIYSIGYASIYIPAKISGCSSSWNRSAMMGSADRRKSRLISREIIFEVFQPLRPRQTDRLTDHRWTCRGTALCVASCAKKSDHMQPVYHQLIFMEIILPIFSDGSPELKRNRPIGSGQAWR